MRPGLTFVHLSDTHLGPAPDCVFHGVQPLRNLERVIERINAWPQPPDFVLHTGDLSTDRSRASYELARPVLAALRVPLYLANGNHDDPALLREFFGAPAHPSGDPAAPLDYTFEVKGERFVVLDGSNPAVRDPLGQLRPAQLDWLRGEITRDNSPLTLMLHYAPFKMASPWLDDNMILLNGDDLHAALLPVRDRLRGVFYGHLHRSSQIVRDGISYTCAPSTIVSYAWRPWDETPQPDYDIPAGYNVVQYFTDRVIVHQYAFPRET